MAVVSCKNCGGTFEALRSDAKWCPACAPGKYSERFKRFESKHQRPCGECGKPGHRRSRLCPICSHKKRGDTQRGERNPNWKGGRTRHAQGYVQVLNPNGTAPRYVLEHRLVWESANGPVPDKWVIHHLNGTKDDNRLENLVAMPRSHHGPRAHIDPAAYEARIRELESQIVPARACDY